MKVKRSNSLSLNAFTVTLEGECASDKRACQAFEEQYDALRDTLDLVLSAGLPPVEVHELVRAALGQRASHSVKADGSGES